MHSGGLNRPETEPTPHPFSEWCPLVILRSRCGALGVQPDGSEPHAPASGSGASALSRLRVIEALDAFSRAGHWYRINRTATLVYQPDAI